MSYYTYITANKRNGTLYVGMTNDLVRRIYEHKNHLVEGFTDKYDVAMLVWFEVHDSAEAAIVHEKRIKHYIRRWKLNLIEQKNPEWRDLYYDLI